MPSLLAFVPSCLQNKTMSELTNSGMRKVIKGAPIKRAGPNVCIFCGANSGNDPSYVAEAKTLAGLLVSNGLGLVYGGASIGIMGTLADAVLAGGGRVHGVIPQALADKEVAHKSLTELRVVKTMHERKKLMFDLSEYFITFPGGFGTLDETFEIITWKQIEIHQKPLVFLNTNGFYTPLIEFIDKAVAAGFIKPQHRALFTVANTPQEVIAQLLKPR